MRTQSHGYMIQGVAAGVVDRQESDLQRMQVCSSLPIPHVSPGRSSPPLTSNALAAGHLQVLNDLEVDQTCPAHGQQAVFHVDDTLEYLPLSSLIEELCRRCLGGLGDPTPLAFQVPRRAKPLPLRRCRRRSTTAGRSAAYPCAPEFRPANRTTPAV